MSWACVAEPVDTLHSSTYLTEVVLWVVWGPVICIVTWLRHGTNSEPLLPTLLSFDQIAAEHSHDLWTHAPSWHSVWVSVEMFSAHKYYTQILDLGLQTITLQWRCFKTRFDPNSCEGELAASEGREWEVVVHVNKNYFIGELKQLINKMFDLFKNHLLDLIRP